MCQEDTLGLASYSLEFGETGSSMCISLTCCITHVAPYKDGGIYIHFVEDPNKVCGDKSANGLKFEEFPDIPYVTLNCVLHKSPILQINP